MKAQLKSKFGIPFLVGIMVCSLLGIIFIQFLWIQRAFKEKEALIREKVYQSVANVDQQLMDFHLLSFTSDSLMNKKSGFFIESQFEMDSNQFISQIDHNFYEDTVKYCDTSNAAMIKIKLNSSISSDSSEFSDDEIGDFFDFKSIESTTSELDSTIIIIEEVKGLFDRIASEIESGRTNGRLDSTKIESLLHKEFESSGLEQPNSWILYDEEKNETVIQGEEDLEWNFDIPLFKKDIIHPGRYHLKINTSNNSKLIWAEIRSMIIMSLIFITIILMAFITAIRLVIKHKKISQIKSDFINNMTHEFKTPLASISIAADSIIHPNVRNKPEEIDKYVTIIQAEKTKLNDHVERILEVAALNKDALEIPVEEVSLNQIIKNSTQKLSLLLEENQAQLSIDEEADIRILGNDFYLERVFMNIIENSIKYAKESAQISIRLFVSQNIAHIHLADQGIGMDQKQIDRVFDNFYRAQSGNVHNTKGFGLGLSYAKLITEKLGGSIKMEGQLNKGCTVKLKFPLQA
ncbi:MAG: HAMP domain-containing histidine kinase [Flavobacteriales bacterium]|nr:HAMP domain-containing histidine kinase [Flavobacteriales bacterium]